MNGTVPQKPIIEHSNPALSEDLVSCRATLVPCQVVTPCKQTFCFFKIYCSCFKKLTVVSIVNHSQMFNAPPLGVDEPCLMQISRRPKGLQFTDQFM